jgi:2-polyprenyl-3-methyl-5-hydroxy-6-metoxy-1,4-benzoquinol methylase
MSGHIPELWQRTKPMLQTGFLIREKIISLLGDVKNLKVLDAGCGEGYISRKLADKGAIVEGLDNDPKMIDLAKRAEKSKRKINYRGGDLVDIKKLYTKNCFDLVIVSGVICFFNKKGLLLFLKIF